MLEGKRERWREVKDESEGETGGDYAFKDTAYFEERGEGA